MQRTYVRFLDLLADADVIAQGEEDAMVRQLVLKIGDDSRTVLFEHPNSEVTFKDIHTQENAELSFGIGINEVAWNKRGDGVMFEIRIVDPNGQNIRVFSRYINPKNISEHRKWFEENIDLSALGGQTVSFIFKTSGGPDGKTEYDWAGWSNPQITAQKVHAK